MVKSVWSCQSSRSMSKPKHNFDSKTTMLVRSHRFWLISRWASFLCRFLLTSCWKSLIGLLAAVVWRTCKRFAPFSLLSSNCAPFAKSKEDPLAIDGWKEAKMNLTTFRGKKDSCLLAIRWPRLEQSGDHRDDHHQHRQCQRAGRRVWRWRNRTRSSRRVSISVGIAALVVGRRGGHKLETDEFHETHEFGSLLVW